MRLIPLVILLIPLVSHAGEYLTISAASDHFGARRSQHCQCPTAKFVEKNWGVGYTKDYIRYSRFLNIEYRVFPIEGYIYTDSFGKPAAFLGRGQEIKVPKIPLWFGYRYGLASRHDLSQWVPVPMGYGTMTLRMSDKTEATVLIIPGVVIGFGMRIEL